MTFDDLEILERTTFEMVVRAIEDYFAVSSTVFREENDKPGDIAEDVMRIWRAGRHSPRRGEDFRVRLSFAKLQAKASWRVRRIQ